MIASQHGSQKCLEVLVSSDNLNTKLQDKTGQTVAHYAAYSGQISVVEYLASEAEVDFDQQFEHRFLPRLTLRDEHGVTPAHIAAACGFDEQVRYFCDEAAVNRADKLGLSFIDGTV